MRSFLPRFILALLLACLIAPPARAQGSSYPLHGDVDGSGAVTAGDALAILAHVVGKQLPAGYRPVTHGDANGDRQISATDALVVLSFAVGRDVSAYPVGKPMLPALEIISVNGVAVTAGAEIQALDSLALRYRLRVPAASDTARAMAFHVLREGAPDQSYMVLNFKVAPGDTVDGTIVTRAPLGGRLRIAMTAYANPMLRSDTVRVNLIREEPVLRLVSLNGQPVVRGQVLAVVDTIRVVADVTVPAGMDTVNVVSLRRVVAGAEPGYVGGTAVRVTPGTTARVAFTARLAPAGGYTVELAGTVFDRRGGYNRIVIGDSALVQMTKSDLTPPRLSIVRPATGTVVGGPTPAVRVRYTASDAAGLFGWSATYPEGGRSGTFMYLYGGTEIFPPSADQVLTVPLRTGANVIHVSVRDRSLNVASDSIVVSYDPAAPPQGTAAVSVIAVNGVPVTAGAVTAAADSLRLTVRVQAAEDTLRGVFVDHSGRWMGGQTIDVPPHTTADVSFLVPYAPPGSYPLRVYVGITDNWGTLDGGEWVAAPVPVSVTQTDVTPPTVLITSPTAGQVLTRGDAVVDFEVSDDRWVFDNTIILNGQPGLTTFPARLDNPTRFSANAGTLRPGANTITVRARDQAGNITEKSVSVTYTPP